MDDIQLNCRDCGRDFVFSVGEQEFFAQKGYTNRPTRCPECRQQGRPTSAPSRPARPPAGSREFFVATCASCGKEARVPFRPTQGRPVYCQACFRQGGRGFSPEG